MHTKANLPENKCSRVKIKGVNFMGSRERFFYEMTSLNPEVTGSCHLVTVHYPDGRRTNFAVDCGLYQEKTYNELNAKSFPFDCESIEFVLITHNHADHMGRLPYLIKGGYKGKIYTTVETSRMMPIALRDSFKIGKEDAKKHDRKMPYEESDMLEAITRMVSCKFKEVEYIDRNIKTTFFMNGHLLGASMILVQISYPGEEDINIFFTGDYKPSNVFFDVEDVPRWVYKLPITIVAESTYGYMDTTEVKYHMEDDLEYAIKQGKTIVISVFAQGRAQEVLYMLKDMQKHGRLSKSVRIRLDGNLACAYTQIYQTSELLIECGKEDFLPENFQYVNKENREEVLMYQGQQIILSTSGMMDHGPAQFYLEKFIERSNVLIYIPGYTSPDTLGYKLQNPKDGKVTINGKEYVMRAEVKTTNECSSHAKADEIIELLQRFDHPLLILFNHGQKEVKKQLVARAEKEVHAKRIEILGEHTFRISPYGYMKHMGAKLFVPKSKKQEEKNKENHQKKEKKVNKKFVKKFTRRAFNYY